MKLSTMFAKLTSGRGLGLLAGVVVAGTALTAAPAAKAQVAFGVAIGGSRNYAPAPAYVAPGYGTPGYAAYGYGYDPHADLERQRAEASRQQAWREHEEFEHRREVDRDRDRRSDRDGWR